MKNIYKKIAQFQHEVPIIHKDKKGYGYNYTPLPTIVEKITPLLKKFGLGYIQPITGENLKTVIFDFESGESIESETKLPLDSLNYIDITKKNKQGIEETKKIILGFEGMNYAQAYGSLITYFRRYALSSILGLVTDTDADARNKRIEKENKPLTILTEEKIQNAIDFIKKGKTIDDLKKLYSISQEIETKIIEGVGNAK